MVLYYSATGNTQYVAQQLARLLEDECMDLLGRVKAGDLSPIRSEKPFVICAPVYVCEMPIFLARFLKKLPLEGCKQVYFVCTSGGYAGITGGLAKGIMRRKKLEWMGHSEVVMPRNYVASDSYAMLTPDQIAQRLHKAQEQLPQLARTIARGEKLTARHIYLVEYLITLPLTPVWTRYMLTAKDFHTTDACTGCGLCERLCPLNNIRLNEGRPLWSDACTHCMACIGNCPTRAIDYGSITQNKDKYNLGRYRHLLKGGD